jgi:hypothetical protein
MIRAASLTLATALALVALASPTTDANGDGIGSSDTGVSGNGVTFNPAASLNPERMADDPPPVIWVSGHIGWVLMGGFQ